MGDSEFYIYIERESSLVGEHFRTIRKNSDVVPIVTRPKNSEVVPIVILYLRANDQVYCNFGNFLSIHLIPH